MGPYSGKALLEEEQGDLWLERGEVGDLSLLARTSAELSSNE